ncbi:hypothetical protein FKV24_004770 [Lysobacter maris]|uniref:Uncharacterized protein n=1 Tax=Marilutibacter maris TaxID=1605891 RepID=A0A508B115_9GAMM|nr:hypothetical protein [Lysobacter maris]KAB8196172.1 hypothetical protein FKV24_004770 [Lysobacter maris]
MKKALFGSALLALALAYPVASRAEYLLLTASGNGPTEEAARQATYEALHTQCVVERNGSLMSIDIVAYPGANGGWESSGSAACRTGR